MFNCLVEMGQTEMKLYYKPYRGFEEQLIQTLTHTSSFTVG